jgi:hypothetical protein
MIIKNFLKKRINLDQIKNDIASRELRGAHYWEKGLMDENHQVLEFVINRGVDYTYAFKIYISNETIQKIERVKFQWECGGWRSKDIVLKRFPVRFNSDEPTASEVLESYICKGGK